MSTIMAKTNNTVSTAEAVLLELADLIIKTYGNAATAPAAEPVEDVEDVEVEEVEAEEADADSLEEERDELMKLTLTELRKRLVEQGFEAADVKKEKSKATLVDALLADLYSEDEEEDEDEEEPEDDEVDDDDLDDDESDDESDEDDEEDDDEDDDEGDEEDDDEDDDEGDEEGAYTAEELEEYSLAELKEIASEWELDIKKGARKPSYITAILEAQDEDEDIEDEDDEEEDEEDLREELEAMSLAELKKEAKDEYGLSAKELKGLDADAIIDLILDEDIEDEDDEDQDED